MMIKKLQQLIQSENENEVIEFKEAKRGFDLGKLGKYFSAISNEASLKGLKHGWLIFGVSDNNAVVGSNFRND